MTQLDRRTFCKAMLWSALGLASKWEIEQLAEPEEPAEEDITVGHAPWHPAGPFGNTTDTYYGDVGTRMTMTPNGWRVVGRSKGTYGIDALRACDMRIYGYDGIDAVTGEYVFVSEDEDVKAV